MSKLFLCEGQYDERQLRERDRTGMQTLIAVFLAVLADGLVREAGLNWTSPQHSAFLIVVGGQSLFGCLCALRQVLPKHPGYHRLFYCVIPVFVLGALAFFACDAIWGNFTLTEGGQLDGGATLLMVLFLGAQSLLYRIQWKRAQVEEEGGEQ